MTYNTENNNELNIKLRMPAEWEPVGAVMLSWPHEATDWAYMLDEVKECFAELAHAITAHANLIVVAPDTAPIKEQLADIDAERVLFFDVPTNDTWARDFGAITTVENGRWCVNDFMFNGWGLKFAADKDNGVTAEMVKRKLLIGEYRNQLGFVLEGGSIESDGRGTIMTTSNCLLSHNRNANLSRREIEDVLRQTLGADRVLWVEHGDLIGDDTDSHIDTLARFVSDDTIIFTSTDDTEDAHYAELSEMKEDIREFRRADGLPYNLIELPLPDAVFDEDGQRIPATYANFLILNDAVLVPTYNQPRKDELALKIMKIAFEDKEIVGIDCSALIKQHGSLHCVTMQFPQQVLPI
jgi:agmatine/peptidylarginine deiminase